MAPPRAMYESRGGGRYAPTALTRGPWDARHQHGGPPAALLCHAIEAERSLPDARLARLSCDILRPVPIEPLRVAARVVRPGRRVELVEASLAVDGGAEVMRASAWRVAGEGPDGAPAADTASLPPPEAGVEGSFSFWRDEVAYHRALDWRFVAGSFDEPGPAASWTRMRCELIAGEPPSPLERLVVMADAASGISAMLDWHAWLFINVDLGIHLERSPVGEWMAMDARTRVGPHGAALCTSELHDRDGRVGVSTQSLLVARRE